MQEEWIPFLEAVYRMNTRLFMTDFQAKPLLRSAVAAERVTGRNEYRERGGIIFTWAEENLDDDPTVIREGHHYFKAEVYPGEVVLSELQEWMESLAKDNPLLRQRVSPISETSLRLAHSSTDERPNEPESRSGSGAPGRPTSMHLVEIEAKNRITLGIAEPTVTAESEVLSRWLQDNHPGEPQLTPKTIRNRIAPLCRGLSAAQK
jgi:hypothetical protein